MRMVGIRWYSDADDSIPGSVAKLQLGAATFRLLIDCCNLSGRDERRKTEKTLNTRQFSGKTSDATDLSALCAYDWKIAEDLEVRAVLRKLSPSTKSPTSRLSASRRIPLAERAAVERSLARGLGLQAKLAGAELGVFAKESAEITDIEIAHAVGDLFNALG